MVFISLCLTLLPMVNFHTVVTLNVNLPSSLTLSFFHQCINETILSDRYSHFLPDQPLSNSHIFHCCCKVPHTNLLRCYLFFTLLHNFMYYITSSYFVVLRTSQLHSQLCNFAIFHIFTMQIHLLHSILKSLLLSLLYFMALSNSMTSFTSRVPFLCTFSSSQLPFHFVASLGFVARTFPRGDHFSSQHFILLPILTSVDYLYVQCLFQLHQTSAHLLQVILN